MAEHRGIEQVFAKCSGHADGDRGVAPGSHTLTISAHVAGAATDPEPVSIPIGLDCGGWLDDAGADDAAPHDAHDANGATTTSTSGGGCHWAQRAALAHAPFAVAMTLDALGIARRRRR